MPRFAVVGHVKWVDFLRVPHVPRPGEILQADEFWAEAAGGGASLPGPVVDAYGAGDSFAAGLTLGLGSGTDIDAALELAARCGAGNLMGAGPYAGQPTAADLGIAVA